MPWSPRRIVTQVGARRCHRPWLRLMRQTALPRHLPDCVGETPGPGGGGVSARVPKLRRRLEGTEPTTCTGRDNLVTLAVVKAAYRSADIV